MTSRTLILVGVVALAAAAPVPADEVIFKDGFVLRGRINREGPGILDSSAKEPEKARTSSFFFIDDGVRRVIFSSRQPDKINESEPGRPNADQVILRMPFDRLLDKGMGYLPTPDEIGPWDGKWSRTLKFTMEKGPVPVKQRLIFLSPQAAQMEADRYHWSAYYYTRELGPEMVRSLLIRHPSIEQKPGQAPDPAKRLKIFRFLLQAGFLEEAERELDGILRDLPDEKEKVEAGRQAIRAARVDLDSDDLALAVRVGQSGRARQLLTRFAWDDAGKFQKEDALKFRTRYEAADESVTAARGFLKDLPALLPPGEYQTAFAAAAGSILAELNVDNVDRLETFLKLTRQAERDRQAKKTPAQTPADLLALAVTGWYMGDAIADANADTGFRVWQSRQFVLEYLRTPGPVARQKLLDAYEKGSPLAYDELAQLIGRLPPPEPEEKLEGELELQTPAPGGRRKAITYHLRLPPEYTHGRSYPVLFVLHMMGEKPTEALARWSEEARRHGYILAAPEWGDRVHYAYTAEEQAAVFDTLRDLRRRFNVDSDRVFLTGVGDGGALAFDAGLSHPDQFAGVVPVNASPHWFPKAYQSYGFQLPFYVVTGDLAGEAATGIRKQFEAWAVGGYPAVYAEYKGRGAEFFEAETPSIFDWMDRKVGVHKRANPLPATGLFAAMRPTDNRFYWLGVDEISDKSVNDASHWKSTVPAATVKGRIDEGTQIRLTVDRFRKVSVFFTPDMIDYKKPVTITVNGKTKWKEKLVTPSLKTLLEELYESGDRQRLILARIDLVL
jgi:pimeloyl-ACP methyl ester carboxylesterase